MNTSNSTPRRKHYLPITLWTILITKCFTFEYLTMTYEVPINSRIYIWSLSLFMATFASIVYLRLNQQEGRTSMLRSKVVIIWLSAILAILVCGGVGLTVEWIQPIRLPSIFAAIIATAYTAQFLHNREGRTVASLLGWWLGAASLTTLPSPLPLIGFAFCMLSFTTLPCFIAYLQQNRRQSGDTIKALTV